MSLITRQRPNSTVGAARVAVRHRALMICLLYVVCIYGTSRVTALSLRSPILAASNRLAKSRITTDWRLDAHLANHNEKSYNDDDCIDVPTATKSSPSLPASSRRRWFQQVAMSALAAGTGVSLGMSSPLPAYAGGLLQFPIGPQTQPLKNVYHFMRAGTSELEVEGIYSTNPLFLTNRENAMADEGEALVNKAVEILKTTDQFPTIAYHSLAANGMDTGDLIARKLRLGREKLLPEFTYLDQRGVGLWDSGDQSLVKPAVWALDSMEGGREGKGGRPPANEDGTPNETLGDQFIRLRQFLSLQESRTSGEIILVIFPDGTGPALLSCMIAGIAYSQAHVLEYVPGELRLDITPESVKALYQERKDDPNYLSIIEDGKLKLQELKQQRNIVGLKEQKEDKEQREMDAAYRQKVQADRQRELERLQKLAEEKELQLKAKEEAKERRKAQMAELEAEKARKKAERDEAKKVAAAGGLSSSTTAATSTDDASGTDFGSVPMFATAVLGVAGLGLAVVGTSGGDDSDNTANKVVANTKPTPPAADVEVSIPSTLKSEETATYPTTHAAPASTTNSNKQATTPPTTSVRPPSTQQSPVRTGLYGDLPSTRSPVLNNKDDDDGDSSDNKVSEDSSAIDAAADSDSMIQDHLDRLAAEEQAMKDALQEIASTHRSNNNNNSANNNNDNQPKSQPGQSPVSTTSTTPTTPGSSSSMDDGYSDDWLKVLAEIRDEPEDDDTDIGDGYDYFNYLRGDDDNEDNDEGEELMVGVNGDSTGGLRNTTKNFDI